MADIIYDGKVSQYAHLTEYMYEFRLGNYVSRGWEIFKSNAGLMVGFFIVQSLISAAGGAIPVIGPFINMALSAAMMAGFYLTCQKISRGESIEFGDFFKGFDHFKEVAIGQVAMFFMVMIGLVCLVLPGIYLALAYTFMIPLIVLGKMPFWDAMETSRKIITKNWFMFFAMGFVYMGIALLGVLAFFVGIFVAIPVIFCIQYAIFEGIVGVGDDLYQSQIDEIGINADDTTGDTSLLQ